MEDSWKEYWRCFTDSICELNEVVKQILLLVENRSSEPSQLVCDNLRTTKTALRRVNELGRLYSLPEHICTRHEKYTNYASILNEGEFWTLHWQRKTVRMKGSKGIRLLSVLLDNPGREFHVMDLERYERKNVPNGSGAAFASSDAGPILDISAKNCYKARLSELRAELEEARSCNDISRASKIREEMDILAKQLTQGFGLRGSRLALSDAERARVRVTLAIKGATEKISQHNPSIGWHFSASVRTGLFCSYLPGPISKNGDDFPRAAIGAQTVNEQVSIASCEVPQLSR